MSEMSDLNPQPLLTGKPIICRRCMHGHMVETITGRANTPVEYHCGYCGNYAIVGVPAQFPFMVAVKRESNFDQKVVRERKAPPDQTESGSSPMQVGEALLKPKKEEKSMAANARCKVDGCEKFGAFHGFCATHFREEYGIAYYQYQRNRQSDGEDPREVARRIKADNLLTLEKKEKEQQKPEPTPAPGTKPPLPETPWVKSETKAPAAEPLEKNRMVSIPVDVYEKIVQLAEQEFRPVDMQVQYLLHKGMSNG